MESLLIYTTKASGLIAMFLLAYYLLLRKETFFSSNRGFLLAGLLTSVVLPLVTYTKTIWVDPTPKTALEPTSGIDIQQYMMMQHLTASEPESFTINWYYVAAIIYVLGMLFFLTRFVIDFVAIRHILKDNKIVKEDQYKLIDSKNIQSPFSFFNYIVYNSSVLQPEEIESIISHEKVHSRQKHSIDMIISQLFCIIFWFNPFMWLYKKSISQNLEFIADAVAIQQLADRKIYQKTLLKITVQPECIAITNHFYQSLIKKRIVMLNKKQSKRLNSWKYGIIIPALIAFMGTFQFKVVAQEKEPQVQVSVEEEMELEYEIDKNSSDDDLKDGTKIFKKFGAEVLINNVTRNSAGEITTINITVKDKDQSKDYSVTGNDPIKPFTIQIIKNSNPDENSIAFGVTNNNYSLKSNNISSLSNNGTKSPKAIIVTKNTEEDSVGYYKSGAIVTNISKDALVIIDGKKQEKNTDVSQLQLPKGRMISGLNVLSPRDAKKKYGREAKKGAVEITTKNGSVVSMPFSQGFTYNINDEDNVIISTSKMSPMPPMPPMDEIMGYARMGVNEGMKALSEMDWQKVMAFEGLSEEDRREIQEEMKNARIEIRKAFDDPEIRKSMTEAHSMARGLKDDAEYSRADRMKEMAEAKKELIEAKKELEKAKLELIKAQKEIERSKVDAKRKSN